MRLALAIVSILLRSPAAAAAADMASHSDEHPGYSRLAFELPLGAVPQLARAGDSVRVWLDGARLLAPDYWPRRVRDLEAAGDAVTLTLLPGVRLHRSDLPGRLVLDLFDPVPQRRPARAAPPVAAAPAVPAASPAPPQPTPPPPTPPQPTPPPVTVPTRPAHSVPAKPSPAAVAVVPPAPASLPAAVLPREPLGVAAVADGGTGTALLPFPAGTGAAALRRGGEALLVFDDPRPIDAAPMRAIAALAAAQVQMLPAATLLRLPLRSDAAVQMHEVAGGWRVAVVPHAALARPAVAVAEAGALHLAATRPDRMLPGKVVTVRDPASGALLLVGTQRDAPDAAHGIATARRTPEFTLLESWQGVAVEPLSDAVELRPEVAGFVVRSGQAGRTLVLAADSPAADPAASSALTRRLDLPALPVPALLRRMQVATAAAAAAPPLRRAPARLDAAQAMLALGMSSEVQALVRLAIADDARLADDPQARMVAAAGAILAERAADAAAIDDPALTAPGQPGIDEAMLWRALRLAQDVTSQPVISTGPLSPEMARDLAVRLPLLLSYPPSLRRRLLPRAVEALALGGAAPAAQRAVEGLPDDRDLDLARAELAAAAGRTAEALARLDALTRAADRDLRDRAAIRAVELRLSTHQIDPARAAEALDRLTYAWRGDGRELALRLRVAELRQQAGQYQASLASLREAASPGLAQSWPDQVDAVRARAAQAMAQALAQDARSPLPPLELVALAQDNADLLPGGEAGQALAQRLADRLCALDLPDQAGPALRKLVDAAPPGPLRAGLGLRLAELQMEQGLPGEALAALSASTAPDLEATLSDRRTVLFARATAARGNLAAALGALSAVDALAADEPRAQLLERAARWPEAEAALSRWAERVVPRSGKLDPGQAALVLRLAAAAAQTGDAAMLERLRTEDLPRIAPGRAVDTLSLLTQRPVRDVADLPRAAREASLTHSALQ